MSDDLAWYQAEVQRLQEVIRLQNQELQFLRIISMRQYKTKVDKCKKCGVSIVLVIGKDGCRVTLDAKLQQLYTLADNKIYGNVEGWAIHKCKE